MFFVSQVHFMGHNWIYYIITIGQYTIHLLQMIKYNIKISNIINLETILVGNRNVNSLDKTLYSKFQLIKPLKSMKMSQLVPIVTRPTWTMYIPHPVFAASMLNLSSQYIRTCFWNFSATVSQVSTFRNPTLSSQSINIALSRGRESK